MTKTMLDGIRAKAQAFPMVAARYKSGGGYMIEVYPDDARRLFILDTKYAELTLDESTFLLHARGDIIALCDEVDRLRNTLAAISLMEYESTSSASEKVHAAARKARFALYGEK